MSERFHYTLTNAAIDEISERVGDFLTGQKTAEKDRLRIRLSLEDILLNWQERFGSGADCVLRWGSQLGRAFLSLEVPGEPFDPLPQEDDEFGGWSGRMMSGMGMRPMYSYAGGRNRVVLKLKRVKKSPLRSVAAAALLGAAAGELGMYLPAGTLSALMESVTDPMYNAFFGILDTLAGPLVFFAVAWGFYGVGDISTLSRVGKQMLLRFLAFQAAALAAFRRGRPELSGLLLLDRRYEESGQAIAFSVHSRVDEILEASRRISAFCEENDMDPRRSMLISLSLEEMLVSIKEHSFPEEEDQDISIRIFQLPGETPEDRETVVLRIRCSGAPFNPIDYYERRRQAAAGSGGLDLLDGLDDSLGIGMIAAAASSVDYKTTFGVNNLTVTL